ncbi:hypothetical protein C1H46_040830 [Malus baccata]|uniref:Uncharacterized protein n=1 Tax=Malus baccata TaxID=106549 RepID=A0A540KHC0_MALBA|nr:hypothetical protein C1H46_040830 [Malus baccata]
MEAAMDEQQNLGQGQGEEGEPGTPVPPPPPPPAAAPESQSQGGEEEEDEEEEEVKNEGDELVAKAQKLMDKITAAPDNPNPTVLHALASLLETQESRAI